MEKKKEQLDKSEEIKELSEENTQLWQTAVSPHFSHNATVP